MKQLLHQFALYNLWANKTILERLKGLSEELINKETAGSFPGLYKTVLHMMDVESVWWQRLHLAEHVQWPGKTFNGSFDELSRILIQSSQQWEEWFKNVSEAGVAHVFGYQNSKREQFKQPVYEVSLHLFNHQTYHRGQIVTMLHQLEIDKTPVTDFIVFSRSKK